jgi:hypothetical protein
VPLIDQSLSTDEVPCRNYLWFDPVAEKQHKQGSRGLQMRGRATERQGIEKAPPPKEKADCLAAYRSGHCVTLESRAFSNRRQIEKRQEGCNSRFDPLD